MTTVDNYINGMMANRLSHHTIANYSLVLKKLNDYKTVDTITEQDLKNFFNTLHVSENYFNLHQIIIKKFFTDIGKETLQLIKEINKVFKWSQK